MKKYCSLITSWTNVIPILYYSVMNLQILNRNISKNSITHFYPNIVSYHVEIIKLCSIGLAFIWKQQWAEMNYLTSISGSSRWLVHNRNTSQYKILKYGIKQIPKTLFWKDFRGVCWIQLCSDCQRFIPTDGFEVDKTVFTNLSSETKFQHDRSKHPWPIYIKNNSSIDN